jgi:hypothetical protein
MFEGKLKASRRLGVSVASVIVSALAMCSMSVPNASAAGPWWQLGTSSWPAVLPTHGEGTVVAFADNVGDESAFGSEVVLKDKLPTGVVVQSLSYRVFKLDGGKLDVSGVPIFKCKTTIDEAMCVFPAQLGPEVPTFALNPYEDLELRIAVKVEGPVSGENEVAISGGGATPMTERKPLSIGDTSPRFGVESYQMRPEVEGGAADTQAGSHPFQLTSTLALNQSADPTSPIAQAKDLRFDLPAGLVGNPTPFPQCSQADFAARLQEFVNLCPNDTAIGVAEITFDEPTNPGLVTVPVPLFNLKPSPGEPARFGFELDDTLNVLDTSVRTGGGYNVVVEDRNITQLVNFVAARVTFWGVPGDPAHDDIRGWSCIAGNLYSDTGIVEPCKPLGEVEPPPLLTLPTSCSGRLRTDVQGDSWSERGVFFEPFEATGMESLDGCNRLPFSSSISVAPDGSAGSTPSGLTVGIHVPQEEALNATGLSPADVKDTTVTLPAGVVLNPAAADGLQACSDVAEPGLPEGQIGLGNPDEAACPEASKVGTLEISSPLLPNPLVGSAYLAAQNQNPFGSLVALYLVAKDPVSGVLVKVAGEVKPDPVTGQLVSTFNETPQLPFEDLKLHFFGGDRAPLGTPALCGAYTTTASIGPWSGNDPSTPSSTFQITSGPNGSPCSNPLPFKPSLTAGTTSVQAGGFTPFTMTVSREDGQQSIKTFQLHMPPGLSGLLNGVKLCGEAEANGGTCGPESLIGETTVSVGLGGDPYSVRGGKVYITGPYEGAPFGVSVVVRAKAGPYDLGNVIVRGTIAVDPITAALTVTIDGAGPYKVPAILDGIPLQIRHINFTTTRPGFTFNPTDCDPMSVTGSMSSTEGAIAPLSVPFQVTNCAILGFKPGFKVSTSGKTSRAKGASLSVKLTYPKAAFGSQANIRSVKVDLPKQLPSRLTTLQKACTSQQFQTNPAGCHPASIVGHATAITPLIPVPLTGPAYFVSYGGAKFPELVIVLQGYGVTLDLHGETFINKAGITSSTFHTVPDAPVGSFELTLPQGPFSALAANGNLCKSALKMPTAFTAQNGATIKQSTPISVTGCVKRKAKKTQKAGKHHKGNAHGKK